MFMRVIQKLLGYMLIGFLPSLVWAAPTFELEIKQHLFYPAELIVPGGIKIKLVIYNRDDTPEEFESYELNREKVIMGGTKATVFIGPLQSGEYPFFGEFHQQTAQGKIVVQ